MPFDRYDAANLLALKNEVNQDPSSMGYDPALTNVLLKLINDPASNVGGETTNQILTPNILLSEMVITDFDSNGVTDGERRYLEAFFNRPDLDEDIERFRSKIREAFKSNSTTVANIDALIRPLSRGEVLFGNDTILTRDDWLAARDS